MKGIIFFLITVLIISFISEKALYWFLILVIFSILATNVSKYDFNISKPDILN